METIKKYFNQLLLIVIAILIVLLGTKQCRLDKANSEAKTYKDSTGYYINLNKELYAANQTVILTQEQLKKQNKELYDEVKKLKETPIVITKIITKLIYRDTSLHTSIYTYLDSKGNKVFNLDWNKDTSFSDFDYLKINGKSLLIIDSTLNPIKYNASLDTLELGTRLYVSLTEDKKQKVLHINVRSDFPGLKFTDIEGFMIDPTKSKEIKSFFPPKRYGLGLFLGYGLGINKNISLTPILGIGISYNLFQW